jgi:plastocyanin
MVAFLRKIMPTLGVLSASLLVSACGSDGHPPPTEVGTTGTIRVTVRADGSTKANVVVQLFSPGSNAAEATTSTGSNGVATFPNVDEGDWELEVVPPQTFALADGEDERKSVTVVAGATESSSFDLADVFEGETVDAEDSYQFMPSSLTISAGTAVRWMNAGIMLHTVTPDGHSEWSATSLQQEGDIFVHTFDDPGTYEYYCEPHLGQGMTGIVTVN